MFTAPEQCVGAIGQTFQHIQTDTHVSAAYLVVKNTASLCIKIQMQRNSNTNSLSQQLSCLNHLRPSDAYMRQ